METEPSTFCVVIDGCKAVRDAVEKFIADDGLKAIQHEVAQRITEMCLQFICLLIIAVGNGTTTGFDNKRIVALLAIMYVVSFIDFDFIPILGNIDDILLMKRAYDYCCDETAKKTARIILKKNAVLFRMIAVCWLLY